MKIQIKKLQIPKYNCFSSLKVMIEWYSYRIIKGEIN